MIKNVTLSTYILIVCNNIFFKLSVNFVPPSPEENKMAGQNEFIDLKRKRGNIPSCVVQPSDVQPHNAHTSTNPVKLPSQDPKIKQEHLLQRLQRIKLEPGSQGFIQHQLLPNLNPLPDPTLSHEEKALKKVPKLVTHQSTKTFTVGPHILLSEDDSAEEFGVALRKDTSKAFDSGCNLKSEGPVSKYTPG